MCIRQVEDAHNWTGKSAELVKRVTQRLSSTSNRWDNFNEGGEADYFKYMDNTAQLNLRAIRGTFADLKGFEKEFNDLGHLLEDFANEARLLPSS